MRLIAPPSASEAAMHTTVSASWCPNPRATLQDLHKGATRLMDNLLPQDKEAADRKKKVRADIKVMWELYREAVENGHVSSTDDAVDTDGPSAPCGRQRSVSPVICRRPLPTTSQQVGSGLPEPPHVPVFAPPRFQ